MPFAIIVTPHPNPDPDVRRKAEEEMTALGFKKTEVWLKHASTKEDGEREIFRMRLKPAQFLVSDFWGMGPD